jgi:hypothetical protein
VRRLVGFGLALVLAVPGIASAQEPSDPSAPGAALVEVCLDSPIPELPTIGTDVCKTIDAGALLLAIVCGNLPVDPASCAELTDGRPIDPAAVDAFAVGWVARALGLQARLSEALPLRDDPIPHTHNSFNAPQHGPSLTTSDPNQRYTMTDQLRMGIRSLELDVHWLAHPDALADGGFAPVLCHGQTEHIGPLSIHVGCTVDGSLDDGLAEIAAFLNAPGNEREVLLLYLQNELDGNPAGHAATVALLEEHLGPLVARPDGATPGACADLPIERSRADLLASGRRVLLVGNCGPGSWSSWVFQRGDGWNERSNAAGYPADCSADRAARAYDDRLIRVTEDTTWLSALIASPAPISEDEVRSMVRCGVELIGLDRVGPADPRLAALVWSWAPDEPSAAGPCAAWRTDARFRAAACSERHRAVCRTDSGEWLVPEPAVAWGEAFATCTAVGAAFAVPRNGWENEQLRVAAPTDTELWLDYGKTSEAWTPLLTSAADVVGATPALATNAPELPATGAATTPWLALVAFAAALAIRRLSRAR